jgi:hypothetical protein
LRLDVSAAACRARTLAPLQALQLHAAVCRLPFDNVPHGDFFNDLPAVPDAVAAAMPRPDGAITWSRTVLEHNRELYRGGDAMARACFGVFCFCFGFVGLSLSLRRRWL